MLCVKLHHTAGHEASLNKYQSPLLIVLSPKDILQTNNQMVARKSLWVWIHGDEKEETTPMYNTTGKLCKHTHRSALVPALPWQELKTASLESQRQRFNMLCHVKMCSFQLMYWCPKIVYIHPFHKYLLCLYLAEPRAKYPVCLVPGTSPEWYDLLWERSLWTENSKPLGKSNSVDDVHRNP